MKTTYKKVSDTQVEITTTFEPEVRVEIESVDVLKKYLESVIEDRDLLDADYKRDRSELDEKINSATLGLEEIAKLGIKV